MLGKNLFGEAARLNKEGTSLIGFGSNNKAIESLTCAIKVMTDLNFSSLQQLDSSIAPTGSPPHSIIISSAKVPNLEDDRFYIFNHTIEFIPGGAQTTVYRDDVALYSSIAFFNIALIHHALGKNTMDEQPEYLRALNFYDRSFQLLDDLEVDSDQSRKMIVAVLNNQAHIHYDLGNFQDTQTNLELLRVMSYNLDFCTNNPIDQVDLNKIFLNIVAAYPPSSACA